MPDEVNQPRQRAPIGRREVLWGTGGAAVATIAAIMTSENGQTPPGLHDIQRRLDEATQREEARVRVQSILRAPSWTEHDLNAFLESLSGDGLLSMKKSLEITDSGSSTQVQQNSQQDVLAIKKELLRHSSNILEYPFRDESNIQYHEIVKWVAGKADVDEEIADSQSTFIIERELCKKLFCKIWDQLSQAQRLEILERIHTSEEVKDRAALASLTGSAALTALSATVYFSGFAFYTTMSVTLSAAAGWFGLTLPMAAYTGASSLAAFLTGPVGWALAATLAIVGVALVGRANVDITMAAIVQVHMLKVAALEDIPSVPDDIFSVVGRPLPSESSTA